MKKYCGLLLLLIITQTVFSQRKLRDLVLMNNGDNITGRIFHSDSLKIGLKKSDHSIQYIPWSEIDSVKGQSYHSSYFSFGLGFSNINIWSTALYKEVSDASLLYQYRYGIQNNKRWSRYAELLFIPSKPFKVQRLGVGLNYYISKPYIHQRCFYFGLNTNYTFVQLNSNFISLGIRPGYDFLYKNKYRIYIEMDIQNAIINASESSSFSLTLGMRFGKKLPAFYHHLNQTHQLK